VAKKKRRRQPPSPVNSRPTEVLTVAWMLSVTTTLVCSSMAATVWLFVHEKPSNEFGMLLVRYLHFSSVITALISLALLVAVMKMRREAPPHSIVAAALIIAALPILAAML
jgi:membrane protein YdbS with pleckstrin-like domain